MLPGDSNEVSIKFYIMSSWLSGLLIQTQAGNLKPQKATSGQLEVSLYGCLVTSISLTATNPEISPQQPQEVCYGCRHQEMSLLTCKAGPPELLIKGPVLQMFPVSSTSKHASGWSLDGRPVCIAYIVKPYYTSLTLTWNDLILTLILLPLFLWSIMIKLIWPELDLNLNLHTISTQTPSINEPSLNMTLAEPQPDTAVKTWPWP